MPAAVRDSVPAARSQVNPSPLGGLRNRKEAAPLKPLANHEATFAALVAALALPGAKSTLIEEDASYAFELHHPEYAHPVARLEYSILPSGYNLHRVVLDQRHAARVQALLSREGYQFQGLGYQGYAIFAPSRKATQSTGAPPWNVTAADVAVATKLAEALGVAATVQRCEGPVGETLEVQLAGVPAAVGTVLSIARTWDPDSQSVIALATANAILAPQMAPILSSAGYQVLQRFPAGGPVVWLNRKPPN